ncbi:hypothetical protein QR685DRAFT_516053 [Neurospora intermedia]|uniref:Secreted protein n=1 Tax=Neurospora intermedia TaxID=5142 RepID=A0ABR3DKI2_NEUIN
MYVYDTRKRGIGSELACHFFLLFFLFIWRTVGGTLKRESFDTHPYLTCLTRNVLGVYTSTFQLPASSFRSILPPHPPSKKGWRCGKKKIEHLAARSTAKLASEGSPCREILLHYTMHNSM